MNSFESTKMLNLLFTLYNDPEKDMAGYLQILVSLLSHRGQGSLYDLLTQENFVTEMDFDADTSIWTLKRLVTLQLTLTDKGLSCVDKVLAIVFEHIRLVREEWLAGGKQIAFFEEMRLMNDAVWKIYAEQDKEEHLDRLAQGLIKIKDKRKILKHAF